MQVLEDAMENEQPQLEAWRTSRQSIQIGRNKTTFILENDGAWHELGPLGQELRQLWLSIDKTVSPIQMTQPNSVSLCWNTE